MQAATGRTAPPPRLNDPDDPVLQQESSWLATKLRRGNCGIEVDMTHALELVGQKDKVDLFVPYVSDGVRLELRFPVSEPERASAEELRRFVRSTVAADLDAKTRFILPFVRDLRAAFPDYCIAIEFQPADTSNKNECIVIMLWQTEGKEVTIALDKTIALYSKSPMHLIEAQIPARTKFEKRIRSMVARRYSSGIARAKSTTPFIAKSKRKKIVKKRPKPTPPKRVKAKTGRAFATSKCGWRR